MSELTIGGVNVPQEVEPLHFLLCGSTGTGKTTANAELLAGIRARGERAIVCDPNGYYLSAFARTGDTLLNPFDHRSPGWSLFNEMRKDYDAERLASSVVPEGTGESSSWNHYAQTLLAEIMRVLVRRGEATTERLIYWACTSSNHELSALVAGTAAASLFDQDASRTLSSTRYILTTYLMPHRLQKSGDFSLRNWIESDDGTLFLTWRADMQKALAPLLATWVDVLANAALSLAPDSCRRLWFLIDELGAIGKLNSLEMALTLGRKHGLCVVAGIQSMSQLDHLYGKNSAITLRSCFRNLLALGISKTDPDTCDFLSRAMGEREVVRVEDGRSAGALGNSLSRNARQVLERVVLSSQFSALPNLTGYLCLAGDSPVRLIRLTPKAREVVTAAFEGEALC